MEKQSLQIYFFVGLLLIATFFVFLLFFPFLEVLVLSTVFGIVLTPLHRKISEKIGNKESLSAILVVILFAFIVIVPAIILTITLFNESKGIYFELISNNDIDYINKITNAIQGPIRNINPEFTLDLNEYAGNLADWITGHLSTILSSVISMITGMVLILISLYSFLKDGSKFKKILISLSPLPDKYDEQIFEKIKQTVTTTVRGVIFIAFVQGILSGIGLWIFRIPNPTLWGSISAVASLVPGLGTAIIFIPAVIYMYIAGNIPFAIGLALWGGIIVGLIDNILGPWLYTRGTPIHPLIMLFSVLGGISVFGPIGFIFGPLIISLFFVLIDIYQNLILENNN